MSSGASASIGIIGASGYVGAELLRICADHPQIQVMWATGDTQSGTLVSELYPNLAATYPNMAFSSYELGLLDDVELVFLALPHGQSAKLAPEIIDKEKIVIDLAADFRLHDSALYPKWYGEKHPHPELLASFVYGLPELFRPETVGSTRVAVPGCYPTATLLGLAPLMRAGLIESSGIIVDAASGVSGAGRPPKDNTTFCSVDENFQAYGLLDHRHTPEIEQGLIKQGLVNQGLGASVLFTPHLVPMNRGILATCYARPSADLKSPLSTESLMSVFHKTYEDEPFVVVTDDPPSTKATLGSNCAHVSVRYDERTGWVLVLSAIDNLVKGAAGQAIQCANITLGFDEGLGLVRTGLLP